MLQNLTDYVTQIQNSRKDIESLHPRFVFQLETSLVKLCYTHCSHCKPVENLPWNRNLNMLDLEGRQKNGCSRKAYTRIFIFLKKITTDFLSCYS